MSAGASASEGAPLNTSGAAVKPLDAACAANTASASAVTCGTDAAKAPDASYVANMATPPSVTCGTDAAKAPNASYVANTATTSTVTCGTDAVKAPDASYVANAATTSTVTCGTDAAKAPDASYAADTATPPSASNAKASNVRMSEWHGYAREDFTLDGLECILVTPRDPLPGRPFAWRAEFFDAFAQCDLEMVRRGYHLAYIRLSDKYGCPWAVERMRMFHEYLTRERGLGAHPVLIGFSRGGLYAVNFALSCPERVGKLYLDAPVLDVLSWPGGRGRGVGAEREWRECLACYGATEATIQSNVQARPVKRGAELARLGIPLAMVIGGADDLVPFEENGRPFADAFAAAGGLLLLNIKPSCGHHPHSLDDVSELCDFLCR